MKIYDRNADEFTPEMTALIEMQTNGGKQQVRIFSLRGAHLIAMFTRTKVAKEFRKWVLDILNKEVLQNSAENRPLAELPKTYTAEMTAQNIHALVWLFFSHAQMNGLLGHLIKPLEAIGSRYAPNVYGNHTEYKRHLKECEPILKHLLDQIKQDRPKEFEQLLHRLTA